MFINLALITLENEEINLFYTNYSREKLNELRKAYEKNFCFMRDGDFIYFSPLDNSDISIPGEAYTFKYWENPGLVQKFINQILLSKIKAIKNLKILTLGSTVSFFSSKDEHDIIKALPLGKLTTKISYKRAYSISSRIIKYSDENKKPKFGVLVNTFFRWNTDYNCHDLKDIFNIIGEKVYINSVIFDEKNILKKNFVGVVKRIDGDIAFVDYKSDIRQFNLSELFIENSRDNISEIITKLFGIKVAEETFRSIRTNKNTKNDGKSQIKAIEEVGNWPLGKTFSNNNGFTFTINDFIEQSDEWYELNLEKPTFVFDANVAHTSTASDYGLKRYGPYDSARFTPKSLNIAVICQARNAGYMSRLLGKLKDGLPNIEVNGFKPFDQGLLKKYKLTDITFKTFETKSDSVDSYLSTISDCFQKSDPNKDYNLAIVELSESFKTLRDNNNPYFIAKARFMSMGVPVQGIRIETAKKSDNELVYILNNMSLAIYSKLGGIPWVMPDTPGVDHELVIGMKSSFIKSSDNKVKRVVGITTVFSGDGKYLLSNKSKDVDFEHYFEELKSSLIETIDELKNKYTWKKGDIIRIVFHLFKPLKKETEIKVIREVLKERYQDYDIKFAFLKISHQQPFKIFDPEQDGLFDKRTKENKGVYQPSRGQNIRIDDYNHLLQLIGPKELKSSIQGMAKPLLISLHENSTFIDLDYLVQQVYLFSYLSWRSFFPSNEPITLNYSGLISYLLGNLRNIEGWNPDAVYYKLRYKRWFL
jgi:hypothetical protein